MRFKIFPIKINRRTPFYLLFFVFIMVLLFSQKTRHVLFPYFNTHCEDYKQKAFSRKLTDKLLAYSAAARARGIKPCRNESDIKKRLSEGSLVRVKGNRRFNVGNMSHSTPCVTPSTKELINEIAKRFREKTSDQGLRGAKFLITSMTRKTGELKDLRRSNSNASENSPHLYGNAFDISYFTFKAHKWKITDCDRQFMKEALAQVIWELRNEKRCWATYETNQTCFHVVCR